MDDHNISQEDEQMSSENTTSQTQYNQQGQHVQGDQYNAAGNVYVYSYINENPYTPETNRDRYNRTAMLRKIYDYWISSVLDNSLNQAVLLKLDMQYQQTALADPRNLHRYHADAPDQDLPPDTEPINVFDDVRGELLVLGAPGSGKTTMLLEMTRTLINRAHQDNSHPIPVVFHLSSWFSHDKKRQSHALDRWLVEELVEMYDIPRKVAQDWVDRDALIPLLDGLDEVPQPQRSACVEAINRFRQDRPKKVVPVVVCSRLADYSMLDTKLRLRGAVLLQPLTQPQIATYFAQLPIDASIGQQAYDHLWDMAVAQKDEEAQQVLCTPLLLHVITLTYIHYPPTTELSLHQIFEQYVQRMLQPSPGQPSNSRYTSEQTKNWLAWLAGRLKEHHQAVFHLEKMQATWLTTKRMRLLYSITASLSTGLFGWLTSSLLVSLILGPLLGGLFGLIVGIVLGIGGWVESRRTTVLRAERLEWSWAEAKQRLSDGSFSGPMIWVIFGILIGFLVGMMTGITLGWLSGALTALAVTMVLVFPVIVSSGLQIGTEIPNKTESNEGIKRSARSSLTVTVTSMLIGAVGVGLIGMLVGSLAGTPSTQLWATVGEGMIRGGYIGLLGGLLVGLFFGGLPVLMHYTLRVVLSVSNYAPLNYVHFLDFATRRILLGKVGGGYIFIHRMLLEYFADLEQEKART